MALSSVYLLVGDRFYTDEKAKDIEALIQKKYPGEISNTSIYLSDSSLDDVLVQAKSLPFLCSAQIFQIRELKKIKKADIETLVSYLENPGAAACLVFIAEKLSKTEALSKLIKQKGESFYFEARQEQSRLNRFVREKIQFAGKTIAPYAINKLLSSVGENASFLDTLLEKLILFAGDEKEINSDMVEAFEENWTQVDVFQLTNALAEKRTGEALNLLQELLEHNEKDMIGLLGILHWQLRRLWLARVLLDEGVPQSVLMKKCKFSAKQMPFVMRQTKKFTKDQIEQAVEGLFHLDWQMKSGGVEGQIGLETWLVKACQ